MSKPRILFWDLETSLQTAAVFSLLGNDYINPDNIVSERYIICASWRWMGDEKVHSVSVLDDPKRFDKDPFDDYHVCKTLHKVLSEADVIVAHHGDSFDTKYAETRMVFHGLEALPPKTSIDTKKVAKGRFYFNSNKLDYLAKFLKVGQKIQTTPGLWLDIMKGSKKAIKEMITYNKHDIVILEGVFNKLRPYIPNYISRELFGGTGCPRCGSQSFQSRGLHRAITKVYQRYRCNSCSGWFREFKANKGNTRFRVL